MNTQNHSDSPFYNISAMKIRHFLTALLNRKSKKANFYILLGALVFVIYSEFISYKIVSVSWKSISYSKDSVKILFVADPQLLGLNEGVGLFGQLTIWDSDRFLSKGFHEAFNRAKPDVVVFLGDLLDEGGVEDDDQYEVYVKRFRSIFRIPSQVKKVFIPGDNDFEGGKNGVEKRFDRYFPSFSQSVEPVKFVDILKNIEATSMISRGKFKIYCNHFQSFYRAKKIGQPHLVVSGHIHKSAYVLCADCWNDQKKRFYSRFEQGDDVLSANLSQDSNLVLEELIVPTCSYRMGFPKMGYGYMIIGNE